jgi:predicted AAA+ superfamily ATPase
MEKKVIKAIITEKHRQIPRMNVMKRPISFDENANYVIVGIRRAGKSYQMFQLIQQLIEGGKAHIEDCLYVNFEDERLAGMTAEELGLILEVYWEMFDNPRPRIFLDEIQNIPGWEKFARRLADSGYRVMITGSNAKMLSSEMATTLGGRYIVREVMPFSLHEYLDWLQLNLTDNWEFDAECRGRVVKAAQEYLQHGGFAETFALTDKREWTNSLFQKILLGDIIARNQIRNGNALRLLARKLAESVMQPISQTRLLHILKSAGSNVGRNSITEYLNCLAEAYLIFRVSNFTDSFSERINSSKYYFYDNGLLNVLSLENQAMQLENLVAIELLRRHRKGETDGVYYYQKGVEVDFYVPDAALAIQVCHSLHDPSTRERELRALGKFAQAFPVREALVITANEEEETLVEGLKVQVIPYWKWML